jgi:hypothetical protein
MERILTCVDNNFGPVLAKIKATGDLDTLVEIAKLKADLRYDISHTV